MGAVTPTSESSTLLASLSSIAPSFSPLKTTILLISRAVEEVPENNKQSRYLSRRCVELYLEIKKLCWESSCSDHYREPLAELKRVLHTVRTAMTSLSQSTPFQSFLQRHEISQCIMDCHKSLDFCIQLFQLQANPTLTFAVAEHEIARQHDKAQLGRTLFPLVQNNADILTALGLREDQLSAAVEGLRRTAAREIEDSVEKQFATTLGTLLGRRSQMCSSSEQTLYGWSVSPLEIFIEGEILGSGTFGTLCTGRWSGTRVAVKRLPKKAPRQTLIDHINMWQKLQHPHIVSFRGAYTESEEPWLVAEFYKFGNAMDYLYKFQAANRIRMCYEISLGMAFLHSIRIVHGDLKPTNVLVDDTHRARLSDFGLSTVKSSMATEGALEALPISYSQVYGKKAFMAPEQLERGTVYYATDVYAFGMSTFQIITGDAPFQYVPEDDLLQAVVVDGERPERPEGLNYIALGLTDAIWNLMGGCWSQEKEKRPNFLGITESLESVLSESHPPRSRHRKSPSASSFLNAQVSASPWVGCPPSGQHARRSVLGSPSRSSRGLRTPPKGPPPPLPLPKPPSPQSQPVPWPSILQPESSDSPSVTMDTQSSQPEPPALVHPDIQSIVDLYAAYGRKIYFSGPLYRVERWAGGTRRSQEGRWTEVWGQLQGSMLSLWDMKKVREVTPKQGKEPPPICVDILHSAITLTPSLPTDHADSTVLTLNVSGSGFVFYCSTSQLLASWVAAFRLSAWERSRLDEIYTAHLLQQGMDEADSTLTLGAMEGWVHIRFPGLAVSKRVWMVVYAGTENSLPHRTPPQSEAGTSPPSPRKPKRRSLLSRHSPTVETFAVGVAASPEPVVSMHTSPKRKDRKQPLLTLKHVTQAFVVYPADQPESQSRQIKVEATFGEEDLSRALDPKEGWLLIEPECEGNQTAEVLKWVVALHDSFQLYGRPEAWTWCPSNPTSLVFGYPTTPNQDRLFLSRELAETLDFREDRTSVSRARLKNLLGDRLGGSTSQLPPSSDGKMMTDVDKKTSRAYLSP